MTVRMVPRRVSADLGFGLAGPTGFGPITPSVPGLPDDVAHVRQARSRCLRCCPRAAAVEFRRPPHQARRGQIFYPQAPPRQAAAAEQPRRLADGKWPTPAFVSFTLIPSSRTGTAPGMHLLTPYDDATECSFCATEKPFFQRLRRSGGLSQPCSVEPVSGFEPLTVRLQGASQRYRSVAGRGLMWRLAGVTVCRGRITSLDGCPCWLPFWLPAPAAQLRQVTKL
jgi:hypothetical protein